MQKLKTSRWIIVLVSLLLLTLAACGDDENPEPNEDPTLPVTQEVVEVPTDTPTLTYTPGGPTLTPTSTFPPTVTPQATSTDLPAATPIPPTNTPAPFVHRVSEGETCGAIAVRYGLDVVGGAAAIELTNGVTCRGLQIGDELIIPQPTGTATPPGYDVTQTAIATALPPSLRNVTPFAIYEYCPVEEDTLTSIALKNGTTQRRICELNPLPDGLDCSGCDFSESAVGFCPAPPVISVNRCLNVPGPTHTPTATATFSGSETATAIPTYAPPRLLQPANGVSLRGQVILAWLTVGELNPDEYYLVSVIDEGTGESLFEITRNQNLTLPQTWQPAADQSRSILWTVEVVRPDANGLYIPIGGKSIEGRFVWEG